MSGGPYLQTFTTL